MFREDKATASAVFFLNKLAVTQTDPFTLLKLMYAAERESLRANVMLLTGDVFVNMDMGPVMMHTYDCIKGTREGGPWSKHFKRMSKYVVRLIEPLDPAGILTPGELELLETAWNTAGPLLTAGGSFKEKVRRMHELFPEWKDPAPAKQSSLELPDIFHEGLSVEPDIAEARSRLIANVEGVRKAAARYAQSM